MAGLTYRRNAWELRYRDRSGKERTERFPGDSTRRPPEHALDRKAEVEREVRRGTYVSKEERDTVYRVHYDSRLLSGRTLGFVRRSRSEFSPRSSW